MTVEEINQLKCGLYMVFWARHEGDGFSLAAVGRFWNGDPWFSPTNWVTPSASLKEHCEMIEKMELIVSNNQLLK